jgi:hypothetical protein
MDSLSCEAGGSLVQPKDSSQKEQIWTPLCLWLASCHLVKSLNCSELQPFHL